MASSRKSGSRKIVNSKIIPQRKIRKYPKRKNTELALRFLQAFPIGTTKIDPVLQLDAWAVKAGLMILNGAKPGEDLWRCHLDNRRKAFNKINRGGLCPTLPSDQRFRLRLNPQDGTYEVIALPIAFKKAIVRMPERFGTSIDGAFRRLHRDCAGIEEAALSAAKREEFYRLREEINFMEFDMKNAVIRLTQRRDNLLR